MNIAVFVSGRGSNLKAILESEELRGLVCVKAVCSDKVFCPAFEIAKSFSISTFSVSKVPKEKYYTYDEIINIFDNFSIDLIVLAGFLKLIPKEFIQKYKNKIINIHPALLPMFGGEGMYGMKVHQAVFDSQMKVSGPTVHFVNEEYDKGLIIAQRCVDISNVSSPDEIAEKVLVIEHQLLPFVIKKFAENKIKIINQHVFLEN